MHNGIRFGDDLFIGDVIYENDKYYLKIKKGEFWYNNEKYAIYDDITEINNSGIYNYNIDTDYCYVTTESTTYANNIIDINNLAKRVYRVPGSGEYYLEDGILTVNDNSLYIYKDSARDYILFEIGEIDLLDDFIVFIDIEDSTPNQILVYNIYNDNTINTEKVLKLSVKITNRFNAILHGVDYHFKFTTFDGTDYTNLKVTIDNTIISLTNDNITNSESILITAIDENTPDLFLEYWLEGQKHHKFPIYYTKQLSISDYGYFDIYGAVYLVALASLGLTIKLNVTIGELANASGIILDSLCCTLDSSESGLSDPISLSGYYATDVYPDSSGVLHSFKQAYLRPPSPYLTGIGHNLTIVDTQSLNGTLWYSVDKETSNYNDGIWTVYDALIQGGTSNPSHSDIFNAIVQNDLYCTKEGYPVYYNGSDYVIVNSINGTNKTGTITVSESDLLKDSLNNPILLRNFYYLSVALSNGIEDSEDYIEC